MINCTGGSPSFKTDLGWHVYYVSLQEGDTESHATQMGILIDVLQEPEIKALLEKLED